MMMIKYRSSFFDILVPTRDRFPEIQFPQAFNSFQRSCDEAGNEMQQISEL